MQLNFEGKTKDQVAIERLQMFEPPQGYRLAFSGGKDSVVIYDLAKRAGVKFIPEYKVTGIDPYELVKFIKHEYPDVVRIRPEKTMWELMVWKQMPPLRHVRYCCEWLKEYNPENSTVIIGVRWQESANRRNRQMYEVSFRRTKHRFLHVIIDWTSNETWEYIKQGKYLLLPRTHSEKGKIQPRILLISFGFVLVTFSLIQLTYRIHFIPYIVGFIGLIILIFGLYRRKKRREKSTLFTRENSPACDSYSDHKNNDRNSISKFRDKSQNPSVVIKDQEKTDYNNDDTNTNHTQPPIGSEL